MIKLDRARVVAALKAVDDLAVHRACLEGRVCEQDELLWVTGAPIVTQRWIHDNLSHSDAEFLRQLLTDALTWHALSGRTEYWVHATIGFRWNEEVGRYHLNPMQYVGDVWALLKEVGITQYEVTYDGITWRVR